MNPLTDGRTTVITVAQLNRRVAQLLSATFASIWVKGEISNFVQAASGHWYFTIKDQSAAVRAVMFRGRAQTVGFTPRAGERFEFRASVSLYEPRGDYQLQVETLRRAGQGDLHEAFLRLKEKLANEGLFDPARKRPIKSMPRVVGVVTSLAAAALRDVLSALARRAPHVSVIVYPAPVQGMDAAGKLVAALQTAVDRNEVDTLLLVRGGGSLEDLWSFNDEALARLIAASPIPVISGVGHETDFTIADFVADLRAPTPTAAAELSCLARRACLSQLQSFAAALAAAQLRAIERASLRLDRATAMLVSPQQKLMQQQEKLRALELRLLRASMVRRERAQAGVNAVASRFARIDLGVGSHRRDVMSRIAQLTFRIENSIERRQARLRAAVQTLEALNPGKIVSRGFAIVRDEQGKLVKNALDLKVGEHLDIQLAQGGADVKVVRPRSLL